MKRVEPVVNEIHVLPVLPGDNRIPAEGYSAVHGRRVVNKYALQAVPPIHVVVVNGNVKLEGVVANEADRNLAGLQARSAPVSSA